MEELMLTPQDKQDARIALLKYYSSECMTHGAYSIALAVGFFGLVEATSLVANVDFFSLSQELAVVLVALMWSFFIVFFIRILGRTIYWGHLTTAILNVKPKEESEVEFEAERTTVTFIQRLHMACFEYVREKHRLSAIFHTLRISTLALFGFYLFVVFAVISLVLIHLS
ncbi:hypothetical protein GWO13_03920 [Candidatus Bathyarchaeota archaeon]|nr:hypothetical protein [Candidatus Bathyarchaeota archaeon]